MTVGTFKAGAVQKGMMLGFKTTLRGKREGQQAIGDKRRTTGASMRNESKKGNKKAVTGQ